MFATRPLRLEWEIVRWVVLLVLATALALMAVRVAAGADLTLPREPALLPTDAIEAAQPMLTEGAPLVDPNVQLWTILGQHQAGLAEEALAGWQKIALPCETEVWRQVAMGMANLQLGNLEAAAEHLDQAEQMEPQNPLVHYYIAILRMDQARHAKEWYDAVGPMTVRLAAYRPRDVVPNTKGMYELNAMQEFEAAIAYAKNLNPTLVLAMPDYRTPATEPVVTVNDLLPALGADKFEAQAHNMLGAMCLERGALEQAEAHMDAAHAGQLTVIFGYRDLGAAYEHNGRHADATRAYLKGIGNDPGLMYPLQKALENIGKAVLDN